MMYHHKVFVPSIGVLTIYVFLLPSAKRFLNQKSLKLADINGKWFQVDETLFEDAIKHVEQVLRNDPYVRFLQSKEYQELLN